MNVAEFILSNIQQLGTDTVFSLTGGMAMHINRAAAESSMRVIYCNHEQAVAASADGYAKAKDFVVPGLAIVTSGPGVTNTITSVASAYYDSVPMFVLAGQVKRADINAHGVRSHGAQETPQLELMQPITKSAFRYIPAEIDDKTLAAHLAQALTGRKGPVFIEIPLDVQAEVVPDAEARLAKIAEQIADAANKDREVPEVAVGAIIDGLKTARRPVLVVGNALRIAGISRASIKQFVEKTGIPTLFTWASFDLLTHDHVLNFGSAGGLAPTHSNQIIQSADFIVFLGTRLDLLTTAFNPANYGKNAQRIVIELDEKEIAKNAGLPNTTFFNENVAGVVRALLERAPETHSAEWLAHCKSLLIKDQTDEQAAFGTPRLTTYQISNVLSKSRLGKYVVPTASGYAIEGIARFFKPAEGATFAWAGHVLGSMGLGLPTAVGAVAALKQPVVCLEGDGGLLLNVQELFTLAANPDLPLTVVVLNNRGYQSIIKSQTRAFRKEFGASAKSGLFEPEFELLAELVGLPYEKCETLEQLEASLNSGVPRRLIDVAVQEDGYRGPAITTKFDENGKPYSTDIGDVTWER
ncbi:thiamine pyrophosphate-binding protein [Burkholderia plantarii]|uniref:thiamine pyrophosphate-binding protein n=1 Tax=Burkholderia plantarii TaxID=41899 RepID=UPI0007063B08|nr:thiamine pyrophosphate-binding protein [Burkholderia plantarii]ALK30626.1 thiamine pyrophosphate TPP-binding domain-containing protein [Burkholderia plantarii]GLZ19679.1 acetolactate synthase catalytic subunit [Burkholderia plantarii]